MRKTPFIFLYLLAFGLATFLAACKKEAKAPEPPPYESFSSLELLWRNPDLVGSSNIFGLNSQGNMLLIKAKGFNLIGDFELIDPITSKSIWTWADYKSSDERIFNSGIDNLLLKKDIILLNTGKTIYAVNAISGKTIWSQSFDSIKVTSIYMDEEDDIYLTYEKAPNNGIIGVISANYNTLNWQTILRFTDTLNNFTYHYKMAFAKNSKGEKLLLISNDREIRWDSVINNVSCFNINSRKIEWSKDFLDKFIERTVEQIACSNNYLFLTLTDQQNNNEFTECVNINNGNLVWEKTYSTNGRRSNVFYLNNNKIIVLNTITDCFDMETGSLAWQTKHNTEYWDYANNFKQQAGLLWFVSNNKLLALSLNNGNIVFNKITALPGLSFVSSPFVFEQKQLLYVFDNYMLNCFKMPIIPK